MFNVLILDDRLTAGRSIATILNRKGGYQAVVVDDADKAKDQVVQASQSGNPFQALLIDLNLKDGRDGINVMQELKRSSPGTEAVIFTGDITSTERMRAIKSGAHAYLLKPFEPEELFHILGDMQRLYELHQGLNWDQVVQAMVESALGQQDFQQTARISMENCLNLGFQRAYLLWVPQHPPQKLGKSLVGVLSLGNQAMQEITGKYFELDFEPHLRVAISKREPVILPAMLKGSPGSQVWGSQPPQGESAALPLWVGEELLGLLILDFGMQNNATITEFTHGRLHSLSKQIAVVLERARLYERLLRNNQELRSRNEQLEVLRQASADLLRIARLSQDNFWWTVLTIATANFGTGFNRAFLFLLDQHNCLVCTHGIGCRDRLSAQGDWEKDELIAYGYSDFIRDLELDKRRRTEFELELKDTPLVMTLEQAGDLQKLIGDPQRRLISADQVPVELARRFNVKKCAALPIRAGKNIFGLLVVDNFHNSKPFLEDYLSRLQTVLNTAGLVWETLRLERQRIALLNANQRIMQLIPGQSLGKTLTDLCEAVQLVCEVDWVELFPLKPDSELYEFEKESVGRAGKLLGLNEDVLLEHPRPNGASAYILQQGYLEVPDVDQEDILFGQETVSRHHFIQREKIKALQGVPVRDIDTKRPLGVLYMDYRTPRSFSERDRRNAEAFANLAALAISYSRRQEEEHQSGEMSRREREISRDMLKIGLTNSERDYVISALLNKILEAANLSDESLSLLLLEWNQTREMQQEPEIVFRVLQRTSNSVWQEQNYYYLSHELSERLENSDQPFHLNQTDLEEIGPGSVQEHVLYFPVRLGSIKFGALKISLYDVGLSEQTITILKRLVDIMALSLANLRHQENLRIVLKMAQRVANCTDLESVLEIIQNTVRSLSPDISAFTLWYADQDAATPAIVLGSSFGLRKKEDQQSKYIKPSSPHKNITQLVMERPGAVWVEDPAQYPDLNGSFVRDEGILAFAAFPLRAEGIEVGAMFLSFRRPRRFEEDERTIFTILAEIVASSMRDSIRRKTVEKQAARLETVLKVTQSIGTSLNLNDMLQATLARLGELRQDIIPAILLYDNEAKVLMFTPATFELYRQSIDNPNYQDQRIFPIDGRSVACESARAVLAGSEDVIIVQDVTNTDGRHQYEPYISSTRAELCAGLKGQSGLLGVLVLESKYSFDQDDIKLAKAVANQISMAIERAHQVEELEFTSTVAETYAWASEIAHEINREVGQIRSWVSIIRSNPDDHAEVDEALQKIYESAGVLKGAAPWTDQPGQDLNLDQVLEEKLRELCTAMGVDLQLNLHCHGIKVNLKPVAMERVLRHLLRNSVRVMNEEQREKRVFVESHPLADGRVEIAFRDNGSGVPEALRVHLFKRRILQNGEKGGFGLLIVRQMVKDMGGEINLAHSEPGHGACFLIRLKIAVEKHYAE